MRPFNIASSISSVHLKRAFLCPTGVAGVAVALLRLVREVGKDIEIVDRREGVGRGGGSIAKVGSRDRGLVAERLTDVNYALCEVKYGALL